MSKKSGASCSRTIPQNSSKENLDEVNLKEIQLEKGDEMKMIKVGKPAPNFTAAAYHKGEFTEVTLEDYKGKWVLLCFYPGDFTFV